MGDAKVIRHKHQQLQGQKLVPNFWINNLSIFFFHSVEFFVHMVNLLAHSGHLQRHSFNFHLRQLLVHDDGYVSHCDSDLHNVFELIIKFLPIPFTQKKFINKLEETCLEVG